MVRPVIGEMRTTMCEIVQCSNSTRTDELINALEQLFQRCRSNPDDYRELESFYPELKRDRFDVLYLMSNFAAINNLTDDDVESSITIPQFEKLSQIFKDLL